MDEKPKATMRDDGDHPARGKHKDGAGGAEFVDFPGGKSIWSAQGPSAVADGTNRNDQATLRQTQEELKRERRFRTLVGEMFGRLTSLSDDSQEAEVGRLLGKIRGFANVDQSSLLLFNDEGTQLRITESASSQRMAWLPRIVCHRDFAWYMGMRRAGHPE